MIVQNFLVTHKSYYSMFPRGGKAAAYPLKMSKLCQISLLSAPLFCRSVNPCGVLKRVLLGV